MLKMGIDIPKMGNEVYPVFYNFSYHKIDILLYPNALNRFKSGIFAKNGGNWLGFSICPEK